MMNRLEHERRELPVNLPIKERREYVNDLFDKMEAIDGYKNEVSELKERLETYFNSLNHANHTDDDKSQVYHKINNSDMPSGNAVGSDRWEPGIHEDEKRLQHNSSSGDHGAGTAASNSIPIQVIFDGKSYKTHGWSDVMEVICEAIISDSPKMVDKLIDSPFNRLPDKEPLFSYHWEIIQAPRKRISSRLYVRTGLEIERSSALYYKIIKHCGYRPDDLKIIYSTEELLPENTIETGTGLFDRKEQENEQAAEPVEKECFDDPAKLLKWLDEKDDNR
jgi:hypothetical protein